MDVTEPGRAVGREIASGEAVEHELDAFVSRRHDQRVKSEGERAAEELWEAGARAHGRRQEADERAERVTFHLA